MGIGSSLQSIIRVTDPARSYWSVRLSTGKMLSEQGVLVDRAAGGLRPIDWSLDLVSTGDIFKIVEVMLTCPNGQRAWLTIEEPGTVFQLKIATITVFGADHQVKCQLIGKVVNKESGLCFCWIWDQRLGLIERANNIYRFESWRDGILPLGALSLDVLGLRV